MTILSLTLALLVARVLTDDADDALAANDLALVANLLDGRTDFHSAAPLGK
jgi:hypothetical protein